MTAISPTPKLGGAIEAARLLQRSQPRPARLVCLFGSLAGLQGRPAVRYIIDMPGEGYRVLKEAEAGAVPSLTAVTPAAAWYERELHDQYGIEIAGHPDLRPLLLHENWPSGCHPMIDQAQSVLWAQEQYSFLKVGGEGVAEVAVGPVHAGVIEPGHFRFSVMGDNVLFLELRHFYTHKGTEKLFQGMPLMNGAMLAESVSGDNCFAHAVVYSQALEAALHVEPPRQAQLIRLIGLELERMLAHIADVGALSGDVAFVVPAAYCSRLKEDLLQAGSRAIGTRYWRGVAVPGGVTRDINPVAAEALRQAVEQAAGEFARMAEIILERPSVQSRFEAAGVLQHQVAKDLGVVGIVGRASDIDLDVRRDHPYGAYRGLAFKVPRLHYGDVLARARVRIEEVAISARLIINALEQLQPGALKTDLPRGEIFEGFSAVESPRGELLYWVSGENGKLTRCYIKSPSFQNWPALPHAVAGNVIADFPLINKSFNLSYSGCDR
ncbi:MAG TPA: NADH-quinone oxidoreductase subunit C [Candidatus Angelobacter sp.]|nr:NADH-quinone oxidoreductase subunit C [Candidatus Angelobacter sp.]